MKSMPMMILAMAIIGMFLVSPVAAATSQGLEWGISTGFHAEYTLTGTSGSGFGSDINEDMYMNVTGMPSGAIPDPLTDWADIPTDFTIGFYWANDTSIGLYGLIFLYLLSVGSKYILPIGNWTLLGSLLGPTLTGETITSGTSTWDVVFSQAQTPTEDVRVTAGYAKADGVLSKYNIELVSTLNSSVLGSLNMIRTDMPSSPGGDIIQLLMDNILYVGIGVGVIVILAIVVALRRK